VYRASTNITDTAQVTAAADNFDEASVDELEEKRTHNHSVATVMQPAPRDVDAIEITQDPTD
jgi:hypothetical protein